MAAPPLLETSQLTKSFAGVHALRGVDLSLHPGEIHAICGENGAGKSTLIKILCGVHAAGSYQGEIRLDGVVRAFPSVAAAQASGIAVIHQELSLCPQLSIAENIFLGAEPRRYGIIDWMQMLSRSRAALAEFRLELDPEQRLGELGIGQQQLIEIVRALRTRSRILILDEPTAALSDTEARLLIDCLVALTHRGVSCIFISHRLEEVFAVSDRVTVLRDGRSIGSWRTAETSREEVIRQMVGRDITHLYPRQAGAIGDTLLSVQGLCAQRADGDGVRLRDISFAVRAGEVLGIGGLMGSGRSELLLHLFGAWGVRSAGSVQLRGAAFPHPTPGAAIQRGLVMVSEDRKGLGLIMERSIGFNLSLSSLAAFTRLGILDAEGEFSRNQQFFTRLGIRASDLEAPVSELSGGNQQKVVLGKALMTQPRVILLDEPTRGIDVGAKSEIYAFINELTAAAVAVVLVSSELPELMGMSDRILMLGDGCMGGEFPRGTASADDLLRSALDAGERARRERSRHRSPSAQALGA